MTDAPRSNPKTTRVLLFAPMYPPAFRGGGPIRTLEALAKTAPPRYDTKVVTRDRDHGVDEALPVDADEWTNREGVTVMYSNVGRLRQYVKALRAARATRPELLYVNSFFDFRLSIIPQVLSALLWFGRPLLLVAPRGEFGSAAIRSKSAKKRVFIAAYRLSGLPGRVTWHASSSFEEADIRELWGADARVIVRQNETLLPSRCDVSGIPHEPSKRPLALASIGRLVEHKGLHLAIAGLRKASAPVTLDVYGPAEDEAYRAQCVSLAEELPVHVTVRFHDALPHDQVRVTLKDYDAMIMPTAGENFGHIIAESLSVCCPVICSQSTPWTSRLSAGGGVVVASRGVDDWAEALGAYADKTPEARQAARRSAGQAYDSWQSDQVAPHVFDLVLDTPLQPSTRTS